MVSAYRKTRQAHHVGFSDLLIEFSEQEQRNGTVDKVEKSRVWRHLRAGAYVAVMGRKVQGAVFTHPTYDGHANSIYIHRAGTGHSIGRVIRAP